MSGLGRRRSFLSLPPLASSPVPSGPMSRSGAYDKLFSKTLASYRSLSKSHSNQLPVAKVHVAYASTDRYPLIAPEMKSKTSTDIEPQTAGKRLQGDPTATPRPGRRPYRGRWNANVAYRNEPTRREAAMHDNRTSRRGRPRQDQRMPGRYSNGATGLGDCQSVRSRSPQRDPPSLQPPQSQNDPTANYGLSEFPMMNPLAMFGGFPTPTDPSAYQQPCFQPNTSEQLQSQFPPPLDPSLPTFFPLFGGRNPFLSPPFLSPAAFMNLNFQGQAASGPMLNAIDQLGTTTSASLTAAAPSGPKQNRSAVVNAQRQAFKAPRPPSATKKYLDQSSLSPQLSSSPQPLLVILDLNGTLIYRKTKKFPPSFSRRAGLDEFLNVLLEKYKVMIWSSSTPATVAAVCQKLFPEPKRKELVAEWGRDKLGLTKSEYNSKIQVYKTLETVWSSKEIQASYPGNAKKGPNAKKQGLRWDQTNTILIDDSKLKAISEPYNLIEIPEFTNRPGVDEYESTIFPKVLQLLEILAKCDDVSKMLSQWTSTSPETSMLDFDLGPIQPNSNASPGDNDNNKQNQAALDPAEARKLTRKTHKLEKKAARKAAALLAARASASAPASSPQGSQTTQSGKLSPPATSNSETQEQMQMQRQRSPSSASSVPSENHLLDRLEETLNS